MKRTITLLGTLLMVVALVLGGCGSKDGEITVASKIDTEGSLLAQMMVLLLEDNGFTVDDKTSLGATKIMRGAITSGEIDIYPEYTGNGAFFFDEADAPLWKDAAQAYARAAELDLAQNNIVWLAPAPANNTWAIAIRRETADKEGIATLDDFAAYVNGGGEVKLVGSSEFVTSAAALPSFQTAYGFSLTEDQLVTLSSGDTAVTEQAVYNATDGVNAGMAYGTDGSLAALDLVVLSDPRGAQPVYEPAPIVRGEVFEKYPELADILNPVFATLDLVTLQRLNGKIAHEGQNATDVAREYLVAEDFLK